MFQTNFIKRAKKVTFTVTIPQVVMLVYELSEPLYHNEVLYLIQDKAFISVCEIAINCIEIERIGQDRIIKNYED